MSSLPPRFARIYRSAWDEKRRNAMMQSLEGAIKFELGHRKSAFDLLSDFIQARLILANNVDRHIKVQTEETGSF